MSVSLFQLTNGTLPACLCRHSKLQIPTPEVNGMRHRACCFEAFRGPDAGNPAIGVRGIGNLLYNSLRLWHLSPLNKPEMKRNTAPFDSPSVHSFCLLSLAAEDCQLVTMRVTMFSRDADRRRCTWHFVLWFCSVYSAPRHLSEFDMSNVSSLHIAGSN